MSQKTDEHLAPAAAPASAMPQQDALCALWAALPDFADGEQERVIARGCSDPQQLQRVELGVLRRAYAYFRARHPSSLWTQQLGGALLARVEAKIYVAAQKVAVLADMADRLTRGEVTFEVFYAAWRKQGDSLRALAQEPLLAAHRQERLGVGELLFYQECCWVLDEYAKDIGVVHAKHGAIPSKALQRLTERLQRITRLGDSEARIELAKDRALPEEASALAQMER